MAAQLRHSRLRRAASSTEARAGKEEEMRLPQRRSPPLQQERPLRAFTVYHPGSMLMSHLRC